MPYKVVPKGNGWVVEDDKGKQFSKKPQPKHVAEAQARLLWSKLKPGEKQVIQHDGAMIALPVPEVGQLIQDLHFPPDAEILPPEEWHITLAYLGEIDENQIDPEKLYQFTHDFAAKYPPVIGSINGYGIFTETHKEDMQCLWLSFDSPALPEMRQVLQKELLSAGFSPAINHGFTPHITLAYFPKTSMMEIPDIKELDVMVKYLRSAWGDMVRDFPFKGVEMTIKTVPNWLGQARQLVSQKARLMKDGLPASAYLVVEDPQKVTTWHLPVKDAAGKPDHNLMGAAWAALMSPGGHRGQKYQGPGKAGAVSKLRAIYAQEGMKPPGSKSASSTDFSVMKQADGTYRWFLISSSAFWDRDSEIVTAKALVEDVARCDATKQYGPLRWWHIGSYEFPDGMEKWETWKAGPGLDLGTCDFNMLHGKMLIESGTFKDAVTGEAVEKAAPNLEVSIGFSHPKGEPIDKQFHNIHRFERSLMPSGWASNLLTKPYVVQVKGANMDTKEKLQAFLALFKGDTEKAKTIIADAEAMEKAAQEAGLDMKSLKEMLPMDEAPQEDEPQDQVDQKDAEGGEPQPEVQTDEPAPEAQEEPPAHDEDMEDYGTQALDDHILEIVQRELTKGFEGFSQGITTKQAETVKALEDTVASQKAILERLEKMESSTEKTQQDLLELVDSRPAGIKRLMSQRPTEKDSNVVETPPAGPTTIDPAFRNFAQGGTN